MRDVARTAANDLVRKQVVQLDGVIGRLVGRLTFLGYYIVFNSWSSTFGNSSRTS